MRLQSRLYGTAVWAAALSLIVSLQLLAGLAYIYSFFPKHLTLDLIYPAIAYFQHPIPRDIFFYRCFVITLLVLYPVFLWLLHKEIFIFKNAQRVRAIVIMEAVITIFIITAFLQSVRFDHSPVLAQGALKVFLIAAIAAKLFWVRAEKISGWTAGFLTGVNSNARSRAMLDIFFVLLITFVIYIPHIDPLVARCTMTGEGQRQNNYLVAAPAYAHLMGEIPYVDVNSWYGLGLPIIFGEVSKVLGAFTYENMTRLVMLVSIVYYIGWYLLLRYWLTNSVWAAAAVLLMIDLQVFGREGGPFVFYISFNATPLRFIFDMVFFWLVYIHLKKGKSWALAAAGIVAGLDIFYITATGMCLTAAFFVYLLLLALAPAARREYLNTKNDWFLWRSAWFLVPSVFFILTFVSVGANIWTTQFWHNFTLQMRYWDSGLWVGSFGGLFGGTDGTPIWIVLLLCLYFFSLMAAATILAIEEKADPRLIGICAAAFYGLMDFQHLVMIGSALDIFRNSPIIIMTLCLWADIMLARYGKAVRERMYWILLAVVMFPISINHHFVAYPNVFNLSRNPHTDPAVNGVIPGQNDFMNDISINFPEQYKLPLNSLGQRDENLRTESDFSSDEQITGYYRQEYTFDQDAALIRSLTSADQKVPVISSQEITLLMQAARKPFFYTFPLLVSRPMKLRTFPTDEIWSKEKLLGAIKQMDDGKPEYVFVQNIFLYPQLPQFYYFQYYAVVQLMDYVRRYYEPYRQGEYLMAMKRKSL